MPYIVGEGYVKEEERKEPSEPWWKQVGWQTLGRLFTGKPLLEPERKLPYEARVEAAREVYAPPKLLRPVDVPRSLLTEEIAHRRDERPRVAPQEIALQTLWPERYGPTPSTLFEQTYTGIAPPREEPYSLGRRAGAWTAGAAATLATDPVIWLWPLSRGAATSARYGRIATGRAGSAASRTARSYGASAGQATRVSSGLRQAGKNFWGKIGKAYGAEKRIGVQAVRARIGNAYEALEREANAALTGLDPFRRQKVVGQFMKRLEWEVSPGWRYAGRRLGRAPAVPKKGFELVVEPVTPPKSGPRAMYESYMKRRPAGAAQRGTAELLVPEAEPEAFRIIDRQFHRQRVWSVEGKIEEAARELAAWEAIPPRPIPATRAIVPFRAAEELTRPITEAEAPAIDETMGVVQYDIFGRPRHVVPEKRPAEQLGMDLAEPIERPAEERMLEVPATGPELTVPGAPEEPLAAALPLEVPPVELPVGDELTAQRSLSRKLVAPLKTHYDQLYAAEKRLFSAARAAHKDGDHHTARALEGTAREKRLWRMQLSQAIRPKTPRQLLRETERKWRGVRRTEARTREERWGLAATHWETLSDAVRDYIRLGRGTLEQPKGLSEAQWEKDIEALPVIMSENDLGVELGEAEILYQQLLNEEADLWVDEQAERYVRQGSLDRVAEIDTEIAGLEAEATEIIPQLVAEARATPGTPEEIVVALERDLRHEYDTYVRELTQEATELESFLAEEEAVAPKAPAEPKTEAEMGRELASLRSYNELRRTTLQNVAKYAGLEIEVPTLAIEPPRKAPKGRAARLQRIFEGREVAFTPRMRGILEDAQIEHARKRLAGLRDQLATLRQEPPVAKDLGYWYRESLVRAKERELSRGGIEERGARGRPPMWAYAFPYWSRDDSMAIRTSLAGINSSLSEASRITQRIFQDMPMIEDRGLVGFLAGMEEGTLRQELAEMPAGTVIGWSDMQRVEFALRMKGHKEPPQEFLDTKGKVVLSKLPEDIRAIWQAKERVIKLLDDFYHGRYSYMSVKEAAQRNARRAGKPPPGDIARYFGKPGSVPITPEDYEILQKVVYDMDPEFATKVMAQFREAITEPATYERGGIKFYDYVRAVKEAGKLTPEMQRMLPDFEPRTVMQWWIVNARRVLTRDAISSFVEDRFYTAEQMLAAGDISEADIAEMQARNWGTVPFPGLEEYLMPPRIWKVLTEKYIQPVHEQEFLARMVGVLRYPVRWPQVLQLASRGFMFGAQLPELGFRLFMESAQGAFPPSALPRAAGITFRVISRACIQGFDQVPPQRLTDYVYFALSHAFEAGARHLSPLTSPEMIEQWTTEALQRGVASEGFGFTTREEITGIARLMRMTAEEKAAAFTRRHGIQWAEKTARQIGRSFDLAAKETEAIAQALIKASLGVDDIHRLMGFFAARLDGNDADTAARIVFENTANYGPTFREPYDQAFQGLMWYWSFFRQFTQQMWRWSLERPGLMIAMGEAYRKRSDMLGFDPFWQAIVAGKPSWMGASWLPLRGDNPLISGIKPAADSVLVQEDGYYVIFTNIRFPILEEPSDWLRFLADPAEELKGRALPQVRLLERPVLQQVPLVGRYVSRAARIAPELWGLATTGQTLPRGTFEQIAREGRTPGKCKAPARIKSLTRRRQYEAEKMKLEYNLEARGVGFIKLYAVRVENMIDNMTIAEIKTALAYVGQYHKQKRTPPISEGRLLEELAQRRKGIGPDIPSKRLRSISSPLTRPLEEAIAGE